MFAGFESEASVCACHDDGVLGQICVCFWDWECHEHSSVDDTADAVGSGKSRHNDFMKSLGLSCYVV